jgi:hypothetical protein
MSRKNADFLCLSELESRAAACLDYAASLNRPLLKNEQKCFHWLLVAFDAEEIGVEVANLSQNEFAYHTRLLTKLRTVIEPDPVKKVRLKRAKPINDRSKRKLVAFEGVGIRGMSECEIQERFDLLTKMLDGLSTIAGEISLGTRDAKRIQSAANRFVAVLMGFVKQEPDEDSDGQAAFAARELASV